MKKTMKLYVAAALLTAAMPLAAQTDSPIGVRCNDLVKRGDSLYIDAVVTVKSHLIEPRKSLTLTPVLEDETQKEGLPSVLLNGRRRQKVYQRNVKLHNLQDEPRYAVICAADAPEHAIHYKMALGWQPWMKSARLVLAQDLCGCGNKEAIAPLLVAGKVRMRPEQRYEVAPTLAYITPVAETEKHRAEVGTAFLDFRAGKAQIQTGFRNNDAELEKIDKTIRVILDDKNVTPKNIVLTGYASPEGAYSTNASLAANRVKALRDYIRTRHDFPLNFFRTASVAEDWEGLKSRVEADANVPARTAVLAVIGSSDAPDAKEGALKALKPATAYRYLLDNVFPMLRRTDYRVDYLVRFFTVEEGREVLKTHPQQLSLSEMFAVANSYEIGSKAYNDVFEQAVRLYSDDPVANLNAANIALTKKDTESAHRYLAKAGDSAEAIHARGVLKLLEGDLDAARTLLQQAATAGIRSAAANLNELEKKKKDNELFDSFDIQK